MSTTSTPKAALERNKLIKFVELLVYDYLHARKFEATGAKFAEECSKEIRGDDRSGAGKDDLEVVVDDADSWYHLAEKLSLPELLQHNNMATEDQRLGTAIEVLVQDMVHEKGIRSRAPSTVSVVSLKDSRRRRRQEAEQTALALDLPRSISVVLGNSASDISAGASEISAETVSKGGGESPLAAIGDSSTESASGGHGHSTSSGHPTMNEATGEGKDRCKTSPLQNITGGSRGNLACRTEGRETSRKHHTSNAKRLQRYPPPSKVNRRPRDTGAVLNKFQFSKDAIRRQQMSHESWIPEHLRMKMMRRSMAVIKENVFESVAQGTLVRKEKKRSNRSELEIIKTQEKFGTKHQRPCALCEQSFSEVNLVLAVPFKAIVDLRIAWQKTLPKASGRTTKPNRTMLAPPQCYNEVKVCAFCSQLFHDPLGYRPTWDMEVLSMRKKREKLAREKEREYWDPLRKQAMQAKDPNQASSTEITQMGSTVLTNFGA